MWMYVSLVATISLYLVYWFFTRNFNYWKKLNIKYVEPVPFFGNLMDSALQKKFIGAVMEDIYLAFPNEKIVGLYTMTTPALLLRDPDIIKQIFIKDFDLFVDRGIRFSKGGLGTNLFHADGEAWRALRTRLTPMFTSGKLRNMFHLIDDRGDKFLDYVEEELTMQSEQNVLNLARLFSMAITSTCAYGIDIDYGDSTKRIIKKIDEMVFSNKYRTFEIEHLFPGILEKLNLSLFPVGLTNIFQDLVKSILTQRNGTPTNRNDFMDLMLQMRQQKVLYANKNIDNSEIALEVTDDLITAQAYVFYIGGYKTSSTTIGFLLYELVKNPDIQNKVIKEIDEVLETHGGKLSYDILIEFPYLHQVINETLRKYPTADPLQRCALADYKVPGTNLTIKKGQVVFVSERSLHLDANYYPNPEVFDPDRFSKENTKYRHPCVYLPFGIGPRSCIAVRFAKVQTSVFIIKLLSRFRVETSEHTPKVMTYAGNQRFLVPHGDTVPLKLVHRFK